MRHSAAAAWARASPGGPFGHTSVTCPQVLTTTHAPRGGPILTTCGAKQRGMNMGDARKERTATSLRRPGRAMPITSNTMQYASA